MSNKQKKKELKKLKVITSNKRCNKISPNTHLRLRARLHETRSELKPV